MSENDRGETPPGLFGNLGNLTMRRSLPVYPVKQTFSEPIGMSQRCQFRNWECCDGPQEIARAATARPTGPRPAPGGTNCPEGRSYQAFTQDLNQTLL